MYKNKYWVTLVEIITVTTILIILWIVWILTFSSYLVSVRDSSRLIELENIESSLWIYVLKNWFYPDPTDWAEITYSWQVVWIQWTFWKTVSDAIWYSKDVVDPLTKNEYTYSIKNTRKEFSIAGVMEERPWLVSSNMLIWKTNANKIWTKKWIAVIKWNYNGEVLSILTNWVTNILAIPSIISSDLSTTDLLDIINNNKLVYNDFENLPASYEWSIYKLDSGLDFSSNNLIVFSWSVSVLKQTYNQVSLLKDLKNAYSWSLLWKTISVNKIDELDLFSVEPSMKIKILACDLVNFKLKYFVECWWIDFITFFIINVLHIDISNIPWTKITTVYQDNHWNFLFWTNAWIAIFDWINWIIYSKNNSSLINDNVTSITQDTLWRYRIWTVNRISRLDPGDDLFNRDDDVWHTFGNSELVSTHIQYIYTDSYWVIWIGTNLWVSSYNGEIWSEYTKKNSWITHNNITVIYNDISWNVWFWTNSQWVDKYNISDWVVTNYNSWKLPDHRIKYIFEDTWWNIWIWTYSWIWITNDYWDNWEQYTNSNTSWWLINNDINYLFEDSYGNIWVWTVNWLSKYNWTIWETYSTFHSSTHKLLWNNIFLINQDWNWNIIIFSEWWLDTINNNWDVITNL